jgi:Reverse transcriptase (RNA-dependent DNA polymerase)
LKPIGPSLDNENKYLKGTGNRWVFTRKDDGRSHAHCVTKGYSHIPGKDFQENQAPVIHDTTFHLIIAISMLYLLDSYHFGVKTTILYGYLEETIYVEFPAGYERNLIDKQTRMGNKKI